MSGEGYRDDQLCLVCLASAEGVGAASIRRILEGARAQDVSLHETLRLPPDELVRRFGIKPKPASVIAGLRSPVAAGQAVLDSLARICARPVLEGSRDYPVRLLDFLGAAAPPALFVAGEPAVLARSSVAVVGSREPSKAALDATRTFAADQAAAGVTVVSGGAIGIDAAAHKAAIRVGATAVVPPVGIGRFRWRGVSERDKGRGQWCVLGQFPPFEGWRRRYALIRNRTIVALADAVVAFEPRDTGGTWHGCVTALQMRKPLFVVSTGRTAPHRHGLKRLARYGAVVLDPRVMPDHAAFRELVSVYRSLPKAAQLPLFNALDDV